MYKLKDEAFFRMIRDFLTVYLPEQRLCSPNTIKSYRESLTLFINFLESIKGITLTHISFKTIDSAMVLEFLSWLEAERNCSISTRNQRLACIRAFFHYAGRMDFSLMTFYNELTKIPRKQDKKRNTVDFMSVAAIKSILAQPDVSADKGVRDLVYMILLYDTGARNQEVLDLRLCDLELRQKTSCVHLKGKGNKKRIVPIMEKTVKHLENYMRLFHHRSDDNSYLFYTVRRGLNYQMSDDNSARFIRKYGELARQKCKEVPQGVHPHQFHHSRAMHLYRAGMPLVLISEWLGHSQLESTLIYAHADTEMKRAAINKATDGLFIYEGNTPLAQTNDDDIIKALYGLRP